MQFGFMKGKGMIKAIFYRKTHAAEMTAKSKKLYFGFMDLEEAFYRVAKEVIR